MPDPLDTATATFHNDTENGGDTGDCWKTFYRDDGQRVGFAGSSRGDGLLMYRCNELLLLDHK